MDSIREWNWFRSSKERSFRWSQNRLRIIETCFHDKTKCLRKPVLRCKCFGSYQEISIHPIHVLDQWFWIVKNAKTLTVFKFKYNNIFKIIGNPKFVNVGITSGNSLLDNSLKDISTLVQFAIQKNYCEFFYNLWFIIFLNV